VGRGPGQHPVTRSQASVECRLSNWVVQMWGRRLTGISVAVVAIAAGAFPLAQSVINAQQDPDDLPRLGETAAEYQARLSRTQAERAAQRGAQTPIAPPAASQTPIPSAAAASPTATTGRTAVEAQTPIPTPRPTAMTGKAVEAQTPIPAPRPTATTGQTVEAHTPIRAPATASPTAATGRTAAAPSSEQNVTPSDQRDVDETVVLLKRGQELLHYGDLAAAQLMLRQAAEAKNAEAALTLGSTYDPVTLRELRVYGFSADVGMARTWYEKAKELGSPEAARRLDNLPR
jgi:hypothetical protein